MTALYIHGSASSSMMWRPWRSELKGPHVLVDLPGALGCPAITRADPWSIETDLDAVAAVLLAQEEPVDLLGHSYGGLVAMHLARRHPDRVRQVIAHEPVCWPVYFAHHDEPLGDPTLIEFLLNEDSAGGEAWMEPFIDWWNGAGAWSRFPKRLRKALVTGAWKSFLEVRCAFTDPTTMDEWRAFPVPLRMTVGEDSPQSEQRVVRRFGDLVPDAELFFVPGGHGAPITHREAMAHIWREWRDR